MSEPLTDQELSAIEDGLPLLADMAGLPFDGTVFVPINRAMLARLVAEVRRLRAEVERLEYALEKADSDIRNMSDYR